jgi:tetratricopeptide (TPR) repeat protein
MKNIYGLWLFLILFMCFSPLPAYSNASTDSLLNELSLLINEKDVYIREKNKRISLLREVLKQEDVTLQQQFNLYNKLYHEYKSFQYDSAFVYAQKLQKSARQLNDSTRMTYAGLKLSFTLLSSGMYKEAFDSLNTLMLVNVPDSIRVEYHELKSRAYHDLASYNADNFYADRYLKIGNRHLDSAIVLSDKRTLAYYYLSGMRNMKAGNMEEAKKDFQLILDEYKPSYHEYAKTASSLASIYKENGKTDKAIELMTRAAVADIKSATREALALMNLAELLYNSGDEARAYVYIKQALEDAISYGARQRKIQVAAILPIIEGERLATVESQRSRLFVYAIVVSLLSLLVIVFAIIIFMQLKQLRIAKRTVTEANLSLQEANSKLKNINDVLQQTNHQLLEANKIKEEYIGFSFNMYSEYLDKIEKLKRSVEKKLMARKFDDISHVMESVNLKKEREALYLSFDQVFLKLFPNFVCDFNTFFEEENRFTPKDKNSLSIELRIFALIRMGIHDHEQIARILEYSVRTIYNYKTKVKNKSRLSNEEFEEKVMEIRAF